MKIAYFCNHLFQSNGTGIARYSRMLLRAIDLGHSDLSIIPVTTWRENDPDGINELNSKNEIKRLPWGRGLTPFCWAYLNWPPIEHWVGEPIDIVHNAALIYPVATRKPLVVTVHDIGPITYPEFFPGSAGFLTKKGMVSALKKADAIIAVSQATADEIENFSGKSIGDRLHIIPEGVTPSWFQEPDKKCLASIPDLPPPEIPFLLSAGKISPRKNMIRVIQAFSEVSEAIPHHLILTGGNGWDVKEAYDEIQNPAIAHRVHAVGYVTDAQLHALYASATALIFPSLFEGFGLPILEAMASGCPVITSNLSSLPEVSGDAALLVNPYSVKEIAEAIYAICKDESLAESLRNLGRSHAIHFTWEACAERTSGIYHKLISH